MLEIHMKLCVTEPDFPDKIFFFQILRKWAKKWAQNRVFFKILKHFVINFHWICYLMKLYIICCVFAQIPCLGKFWFLRYRPNCSQPIRLQDFLISYISRTNQWNCLILCMWIQIHMNEKFIKNFLDCCSQKWVWPVLSQDSKFD